MHVLRAERGYTIVGQDTDGTVTPQDAGMEWVVSTVKDFIGKRSYERAGVRSEGRKHLVSVMPMDGTIRLPEGTQIVDEGVPITPAVGPVPMQGFVTLFSAVPSQYIGFAGFSLRFRRAKSAPIGRRTRVPKKESCSDPGR